MGGKKFTLSYCAAAYYEDSHGVTFWFTETPNSEEERKTFERTVTRH